MRKVKMDSIQYAKLRKVTPQRVQQLIKAREAGRRASLPGVVDVERFSRFYVLTVKLDEHGNLSM